MNEGLVVCKIMLAIRISSQFGFYPTNQSFVTQASGILEVALILYSTRHLKACVQ